MNLVDKLFDVKLPALPEAATKNDAYQDLMNLTNAIRGLRVQALQASGAILPLVAHRNIENLGVTAGNSRQRAYVTAGVDITGYQLVNFYLDAGVTKVRLANATNTSLPAHGMAGATGALSGEVCEVMLPGCLVQGFIGLTVGALYYTSTVAGSLQTPNPGAAGNLVQAVGVAITPTDLFMNMSYELGVI
jgi:hypothetical protein